MINILNKRRVLNLYAGIGGNRKLWRGVDVTAVEINPEIASAYKALYPDDKVIIDDAHEYLLNHYSEYDLIWSSPPCPTHSQMAYRCNHLAWGQKSVIRYPDMSLYQEIIFLKYFFKGLWVVENTESYYKPLIPPKLVQRHYFWSNFPIKQIKLPKDNLKRATVEELQKRHGIDISEFKLKDKRKILRNCVTPVLGLHVFNCGVKLEQTTLGGLK